MTFFATITKQRQLNIPARAMEYAASFGFKSPGQVKIDMQDGNLVVSPVKDFLEMRGALAHRAIKGKTPQEIIRMEHETVAQAHVDRYLRSLPKKYRKKDL